MSDAPSRRVRLLVLAGGLGLGGSERQLHLLLSHMDESQFERHVLVFNSQQDALIEPLQAAGVRVSLVPRGCRSIARRARFVHRFLRELRPDIVHSWILHDNPYAGIVGHLAGVPARLGSQRNASGSTAERGLSPFYRHLSIHSVSQLVVNSHVALRVLVSDGCAADRLAFVPNGVDPSLFDDSLWPAADLSAWGIDPAQRVVGIVANLRRQKNHLMFVEAMAAALSGSSQVCAIIVGCPVDDEPDVLPQLNSAIERLRLRNRVFLLGSRPDVPALMRRMAVCCLTSDYEGTPNVVLEAMAAATPVVATRVGDVPDLVEDGVSGFLVRPADAQAFARAVRRLLDDPELATRMGEAGRRIARRRFSCEAAVQRLTDVYLGALGQRVLVTQDTAQEHLE